MREENEIELLEDTSEVLEEKEVPIKEDLLNEKDQNETIINEIKENKEENKTVQTSKQNNVNKSSVYISYEFRLAVKIISTAAIMIIALIFLLRAISSYKKSDVTYDESNAINYRVCLEKNDEYKEECLEEGMEYLTAITKNINATFSYNAVYNSKVSYDYKYYIKSNLKIYKPDEEGKVLYKSSETLLKKKRMKNTANVVSIVENIDIPFSKYNKYVRDYKNKYSLNSNADLEISLYLEGENIKKNLGKMIIPLSKQTFDIKKEEFSNSKLSTTSIKNAYKNLSIIYSIIACLLSIISLVMIIRLIIYILRSTSKKNQYASKISQILKEYDRVIVQVDSGNNFVDNKKIIKVSSFLELLDVRDTLEKPIIYVKVNNIKSEFYVDDIDKVYKYTMKESDFIKK